MQEFDQVDLSFFDDAPVRFTVERRIPCSAAALFRSFEHPEAWKGWLDLDVEWTCEKPYGVGAPRTIGGGAAHRVPIRSLLAVDGARLRRGLRRHAGRREEL